MPIMRMIAFMAMTNFAKIKALQLHKFNVKFTNYKYLFSTMHSINKIQNKMFLTPLMATLNNNLACRKVLKLNVLS